MARHHLIDNDVKLFFNEDSKSFKKKISQRVYSPWHTRSSDKWLKFPHMILSKAISDQTTCDWKAIFVKLAESGYVFTSSDYFPDEQGRHIYLMSEDKTTKFKPTYFDMFKESNYLDMIKELHLGGITVDENELLKFIKKSKTLDTSVINFFSSIGFNLETTLLENSINKDIETLVIDNYDNEILNGRCNERIKIYQEEQLVKSDRIKAYLNNNEISSDRANEIYRCFKVSYPKMNTYPEFKDRYLADICIFYHCAKELRTEAFFMDVQVDLIKLLEEKSSVKFLQDHNKGSHRGIGESAGKMNHWEL